MSKSKKSANADETETGGGEAAMIDPNSTAPSNASKDNATATATEPNSKQRVAQKKASRTGRGNGGAGEARGGLNVDLTPDTLGEREAVSPGETDAIWTNASKDNWGNGQPGLDKLLAQRDEIAKQKREREE